MNQDQVMVILRTVLQTFAPLLVARGVVPSDSLSGFEAAILAAVGALMTLGTMVWGIWVQSHASKIASVNTLVATGNAAVTVSGTVVPTPKA